MLSLLASFAPASLRSQVCAAYPALDGTRFRLGASVASHTYATSLLMSFTAGKRLHGTLGVGRTRDGELEASSYPIDLEAGWDVPLGRERAVFLCPIAAVSLSVGPNGALFNTAINYLYYEVQVGLGIAGVAGRSERLTVTPAGGVRVSRLRVERRPNAQGRDANVPGGSGSDTYYLITLAVGLVLDEFLTIQPNLTVPLGFVPVGQPKSWVVPFGREEGELSLGISVGISFGKRSRSSD